MDIRPAQPADIREIGALYVANHRETYRGLLSPAYIDSLTEDYGIQKWSTYLLPEKNRLWVARENGVFLGFAAATEDAELENTWYLDSLHVSPAARGKGAGTALLRAVGRWALENGYAAMSVCIVRGNDRAGDLYRSLGAEHLKYFEDDFCGTVSQSEKLIWHSLAVFAPGHAAI